MRTTPPSDRNYRYFATTCELAADAALARELLQKQIRRMSTANPKWDALWFAACVVGERLQRFREQIAEACEPWFDEAAARGHGYAHDERRAA